MPTTTKYIWDDDNLLAEADRTDTINTVYTNEPEQYGNLISSRIAATTSYHEFDALGSTRQLTNSGGGTTDVVVYDAWGSAISRIGTTSASLLWVGALGYYFDIETGVFAVRDRTYGPRIGRWTSVDPGGFRDGPNLYAYVFNAVLSLVDPSGRAVDVHVKPKKVESMDWCAVKTKDPEAPKDQYDPKNGLDEGIPGQTIAKPYKVECVCDCCEKEFEPDKKTHKREIHCTVIVWVKVIINTWLADQQKSHKPGVPDGRQGVYGHEQMHVAGFLKGAKDAEAELIKLIGGRKCIIAKVCRDLAPKFAKAGQDKLAAAAVGHGKGGPARGSLEAPQGKMPKDPNCKEPGQAPDFPDEIKCSDEVAPGPDCSGNPAPE
jgi:RHS repeat-associated protein